MVTDEVRIELAALIVRAAAIEAQRQQAWGAFNTEHERWLAVELHRLYERYVALERRCAKRRGRVLPSVITTYAATTAAR